jgi:hypothetical protein
MAKSLIVKFSEDVDANILEVSSYNGIRVKFDSKKGIFWLIFDEAGNAIGMSK